VKSGVSRERKDSFHPIKLQMDSLSLKRCNYSKRRTAASEHASGTCQYSCPAQRSISRFDIDVSQGRASTDARFASGSYSALNDLRWTIFTRTRSAIESLVTSNSLSP